MRRKILLVIFFIVLIFYAFYKSPLGASIYYNKAKALYNAGQYEKSLPMFERSLFASPNSLLPRFYYVLALSKSEPTYSIQKKLYEMGNSKINDEAKKQARYQAVMLRYKLLIGVEDNYIYNAISGNDVIRWDIRSFPLKIYYENLNTVPPYYKENIDKALMQWTNRTNFIKFVETTNENEANIVIKFSDIQSDTCKDGVCTYTVAYTDPVVGSGNLLKRMNLTFYKTNPRNQNFTPLEVYNTALHEIGHTLGIMGHSDHPGDLMFPSNENNQNMYAFYRSEFQYLTPRDVKTLVLLYRLAPTITNTRGLKSESFYYAPLILGNMDVRVQQKLKEFKKYIQDYPNFAAGYINIASVYVDSGNFEDALNYLNTAESIAKTSDEKYLIAYNRSIIYYNKQDYSKALEYAQIAKTLKDSSDVNDLISDIQKLQQ